MNFEEIMRARQRRFENVTENQLASRTTLLSESQNAMMDIIRFVMDSIDNEAAVIYSANDIVASDQDAVIFSKVRLQMLKEIRDSNEFKTLLDICDKIEQEWDKEKEA